MPLRILKISASTLHAGTTCNAVSPVMLSSTDCFISSMILQMHAAVSEDSARSHVGGPVMCEVASAEEERCWEVALVRQPHAVL